MTVVAPISKETLHDVHSAVLLNLHFSLIFKGCTGTELVLAIEREIRSRGLDPSQGIGQLEECR